MSSIPATAAPPPAFFFNDTATTEIYTLSLHDALPISGRRLRVRRVVGPGESPDDGPAFRAAARGRGAPPERAGAVRARPDRKSTRLNSSHSQMSYAVFCLKTKTTLCLQALTVTEVNGD